MMHRDLNGKIVHTCTCTEAAEYHLSIMKIPLLKVIDITQIDYRKFETISEMV